ncbi:MAG: molybdopterin-dependent oxidoreductase [Candidatus Marinimicrobia bacterium]|jgi:putative selenate reductase molybdopterin-binding subunit|nr:molybdopterin-dependent oxidoreductase [Candidatus Neomarinimicrobiota bacterium]MBT4068483.1 molybdopterin-dependent oxidoreductase [Candidatus Neomarinimicrobiota bacterium]MBT4271365.1 molybdopterin-dependent oxidoreductase [Candidatus Neomarinimicrobiota bacterium]MBT4453184.1 molybdopterin-dependent oxidoreductase [Candidatus Neomarinimicrobiota bacterium]MBT5776819.1 molybdopterin-dependent oxidoreductase [Candidatus Neomarinimicrobiota bacterium]|tara:strand:+ start:3641 stop:5932 length:2292 start_codon:yes stop_codon:yes gene_type:complete
MKIVGKKTRRVDGLSLAKGKAVFADDMPKKDYLYAKILHSPIAHGKIVSIDKSKALALDGIEIILTHEDFTPHYFTTAGQGYPEPSPRDTSMFNKTMRFVGDRVAVVAGESLEVVEEALALINVEYEELPTIFDMGDSIDNDTVIHPGKDGFSFLHDASRNIAANISEELGDVQKGFNDSDYVFEGTYFTPYAQQCSIEPHITLTWLDENDRLIIRTATQVPYHVRRVVAEILDIPVRKIRVIKPRIGGGFGGKQEILNEEVCSAVTLNTGKPCRLEYTREEEFYAARSRHPQKVTYKIGLNKDLMMQSIDMEILQNCGGYGPHALTVMSVSASKTLALYRAPNVRIQANAVYTNLPPAGAYRGYGAPQGYFALESLMDEIAEQLNVDPIELRKKNYFREGEDVPIAKVLGEGREGFPVILQSNGIDACIDRGRELIDWDTLKNEKKSGIFRRGVGMATVAQASGIAGIDMGSVFIKMNEDGSFNLNMGATDLGTGSDTALAQIAAEVLDVPVDKMIVISSDTDTTPFDTGAYASSTTYVTGAAVKKAAEDVLSQILEQGKKLLEVDEATIENNQVVSTDGQSISYQDICTKSFYTDHQTQIQAVASKVSYDSPPPYNATFADVIVDTETGFVKVNKIVSITDSGQIINPQMSEGQAEGAIPQSLGMTLTEHMIFDDKGRPINTDFENYHIYTSIDMPEIIAEFVHTDEPTGPYGAKAVAEIPINGPAPAVANAIYNACGVRIRECPITPEKVLNGINQLPIK